MPIGPLPRVHGPAPGVTASRITDTYLNNMAAAIESAAASEDVYLKPIVDALFAAYVEAINARREAFPISSGNRVNTFTHGVGLRVDLIEASTITADRIYGSILYLPEETTFNAIGINVTTAIAASSVRLGIAEYTFSTKTASNILDAGTVDSSTTGDKTRTSTDVPSALWTRGPGWIILMAYFSHGIGVQVGRPASGYSYNTAGTLSCAPVQTGSAFSAFGATEFFNADTTAALSTWLVAA